MRVERGPAPEGIDVGETTYEPETVTVRGAASAVALVVAAEVVVALDPQGFDVDREVEAHPVDANGDQVTGIDVEPATVHVQIPLFTDKESRTLPVNPVISGSPAPGLPDRGRRGRTRDRHRRRRRRAADDPHPGRHGARVRRGRHRRRDPDRRARATERDLDHERRHASPSP